MTYDRTYRSSGVARLVVALLVVWLIIGAIAAGQRGYYSGGKDNCASFATVTVTILAGPLNYVGVNPKVNCNVPQPSK
jgi:membrane protein YdbS with pleckstrin-like domain